MASGFLSKLFDLIASPLGLVGIVICLIVMYQARRYRPLAWLLFSLCCFAASLNKFQDEFIKEPPSLVFPLEQLRNNGRPLAIVLLGMLVLIALQTKGGWRRLLTPEPVKYLILVQAMIFFKTLAYGSIGFAFLALLTFAGLVMMFRFGPSRWLEDEQNFYWGVWSLAMVGMIFVVANAYQAFFDINAITFVHGRLLGTTGNPQHAAVLLAATVPCFMFMIESQKQWGWVKYCWITSLVLVMFGLFLTGSRTGAIMGVVSILLFYRNKGGTFLRLGLVAGIILAILLPLLSQEGAILGTDSAALTDRYSSISNTRTEVWTALWNGFMNNLLFGVPLRGDRLMGYGENSWLGAGAALGLLGFILIVMFGFGCLKMMLRLNKLSINKPIYSLHTSTVIAGLSSLLVGSFFEAFLLGNITFALMAVLMYLSVGNYLLELDGVEREYWLWQKTQMKLY